MGSCIICGKSTDGLTCSSHEEDVAFEFRGDRPEQLVSGRYYRGAVDGFADFGVFIDISDGVTGLLHESELDRRLDSLDWDPGDPVYVQVTGIHDNGNVDLGWSLRQSAAEFRGTVVQDPDADPSEYLPDGESGGDSAEAVDDAEETEEAQEVEETEEETTQNVGDGGVTADDATGGAESAGPDPATEAGSEPEPDLVRVDELANREGDRVRVEGEIVDVFQTGGPTIFELADETATVECAAFVAAGERAHPEIEAGDFVSLVGEVEHRRGSLQVETESIERLDDESRTVVENRMEDALAEEARPAEADLLAADPAVEAVHGDVIDAAAAVRRAVIESRPVVVRHPATVDGYVAGAAVERAVLPLVREANASGDAEYHQVERRPLEDDAYDMSDATNDLTSMLGNADRHGEAHPLFVFVGVGGTRESLDGLELLATYDAPRVVVEGGTTDPEVESAADVFLTGEDATVSALAANVAVHVNPEVREDLLHLPAISYWESTPDAYADLASESGYDAETVRELREAIALAAFYQSYEDKRELVQDLFWEEDNRALATHVSTQFRRRLDTELDTVDPHLERRGDGVTTLVLDAAAFTHRFDFPPTTLLLDALHRRERDDVDGPLLTVCVDEDQLRLRSTAPLDVRAVAETVADRHPDAGVRADASRHGRIAFLRGERDVVRDAVIEEATARLGDD